MGNSKRYFVSLMVRKIVLRVILISSLSSFLLGVVLGVPMLPWKRGEVENLMGGRLIGLSIVPLSVSFHHTLRLWPRNKWSVRTDLIYSAVELCFVTGYLIAETIITAEYIGYLHLLTIVNATHVGNFDSLTIWECTLQVAVTLLWISTTASFVFTIWNLRASEYRTIGLRFDFMENHNNIAIGRRKSKIGRWSLLLGESIFRKRFGMDRTIVRGLRAGISILCLLGMIALGCIVLIIRPMQRQMYIQSMRTTLPEDSTQNMTMHVAVVTENSSNPDFIDSNITWHPGSQHITCHATSWSRFACNDVESPFSPDAPDYLTIKIDYTRALQNFSLPSLRTGIYLNFNTDLVGDYLENGRMSNAITLPIQLCPGFHLFGTTFYSFKDTYTSSRDLTFGISRFNRQLITNVQALIPDPEFSNSPSDNATVTLRLTYQSGAAAAQLNYEIQREQSTNPVVSGFALLGGIWTFINGLFAVIFGCSLLLVLWGIKPLSIYGLVHLFQGRRSLVDGGYTLSPEEQS